MFLVFFSFFLCYILFCMKYTAVFLFILFGATLLAGCRYSQEREYVQIRDSGLSGEALLQKLSDFEIRNMDHFSSKVDLGGYYLLAGNPERAGDYFRRAEALVPKYPKTPEIRKNIAIMYASLARIALLRDEFDTSLEYAEKAIAAEKDDAHYLLLKANILMARGERDAALALFDGLYPEQKDLMSGGDIRSYLFLLAQTSRADECAALMDSYFEKGAYYPGLGLYASSIYEAGGQPDKAILAAFLDYEFYSGYTLTDDRDFLKNIDTLEGQLNEKGSLGGVALTLQMVRSLYTDTRIRSNENISSFFVEDYIRLKKKIMASQVSFDEFQAYLTMERYFTRFPVYYWNMWQAAVKLPGVSLASYVPALEKIIALDKDGRYAKPAWEALTGLMGYGEK
jgi:tetratricopeptide (TPR) repeat protein